MFCVPVFLMQEVGSNCAVLYDHVARLKKPQWLAVFQMYSLAGRFLCWETAHPSSGANNRWATREVSFRFIIRRLMPSSQESGTGRTRVPHEPSSRLHAVFRTWNKFYCCLLLSYLQELSSLCRYSKQKFARICHYFQVCCILCLLSSSCIGSFILAIF